MRVMSTWEGLLVRSRFSGKGEDAARRFCFCSIFRTRSASKSFNHRGHRGPLAEGQNLHHEGHEGTTTKGTKGICIRFRLRTPHELALQTAQITCEAGRPRPASALHCRGHRGPLAEGQKLHHEGHEGTTTKGTKEICIRFRLRTLHELALPTAKITCEARRPRPASALHWRRACVRSCQICRRSRTPASAPAGPIPGGRSSACADLPHESLAPVRSARAG